MSSEYFMEDEEGRFDPQERMMMRAAGMPVSPKAELTVAQQEPMFRDADGNPITAERAKILRHQQWTRDGIRTNGLGDPWH